jgi:steroid 5-alpha reductase family enzyme
LITVIVAGVVTVAVMMAATCAWSFRVRLAAVVDPAWGGTFAVAAVVCAITADVAGTGDAWRGWIVAVLVVLWGGRLAWHLLGRLKGTGEEDPRYAEMLKGSFDEVPASRVIVKVFGLQGVIIAIILAPVYTGVGVTTPDWGTAAVVVGAIVWAIGVIFESVGDAQLKAFKADPNRGKIMDRGLWGWTRHPNYFGDSCVWWGLWLVGGLASGWVAALCTVLAPVVMTLFLTQISGAKLLEKKMSQREGWDEYAARVPMFFPRPPRHAE